ncbi:QRFP-like peptide receptor [Liolophura sinensis]|uniref:QRFP-like peptide receptor n=1 Tax=Liolophura sinensis TaxID=3198878 RepID=UPI003158D85E
MVACICMWIHLATDLSTEYPFGKAICRVGSFLQVLSVTVSVLSLTAVVLNRFLSAITRTFSCVTQTRYKLTIFLIWLIGVVLSFPWLLYTKLVDFDWAGGHERYCVEIFPSKSSRTVYVTFFTCCVYAAPLTFMLILATVTLAHPSHTPSAPTSQMALRMKRRAQQMILVVLITFIICWTPQQATLLWDVYRDPDIPKPTNIAAIKYTAIYLAYSNSAINPIIYIVFNDCFQHVLWKFARCKIRPNAEIRVTPASAQVCSVISVSSS